MNFQIKNRLLILTGAGAMAMLVAGCTTTGNDVPSVADMLREDTGQNGRACIRQTDMRGYGILKNRVLSIDGQRNYYLATVHPGCTDLQTGARSIFSGSFGEICGQRMDAIATQGDLCTIGQIYEFENREAAFETYNAIQERREELKSRD